MFNVGDRVICIYDEFPPSVWGWGHTLPLAGRVYQIRGLRTDPHYLSGEPGIGVWLVEITNPPMINGEEPTFTAGRFRKTGLHEGTKSNLEAADIELSKVNQPKRSVEVST